ncbi:MAG: GGDEF domain-containing protein [Pseudobacteriovorax sp.]|nr:GGDEF domain-containing protein [Pseudobacteriovorax sp.]
MLKESDSWKYFLWAFLFGLPPLLSGSLIAMNTNPDEDPIFVLLLVNYVFWLVLWTWIIGRHSISLQHDVEKDSLTILYNQNAFYQKADYHFQMGVRYRDELAIVMMDIDNFKSVNDTHSHLLGSAVLKQIAEIISSNLRETDIVARFGGDEFILCLPRTSLHDAYMVANRIRQRIEDTNFVYKKSSTHITISAGVASMNCTYQENIELLVEQADENLYKAKKLGRNQVYKI